MPYCFLNYLPRKDDNKLSPDCPDEVGTLLLADLPGLEWGLFDVTAGQGWSPQDPATADLAKLIESAKRYPPALALAREEVGLVFENHRPERAEFGRVYGAALQTHLFKQHEAPYVLAPALKDEVGYLRKGEWYWLLQVAGSPPVLSWVSHDFHMCNGGINDFDLTGAQLKHLGYVV